MLVHLFGSISSPSCANSALLRTADDNEDQFDQEVATVIRSNFYVDDCLVSVESEEKAISLVREVTKLCRQGGFRLSKWVTNRHSVLESVEPGERNTGVKDLNLASDKLPNERALGVQWSVDADTLGFSISPKEVTLSRRAILSTVSSIFDPLGLAAPFTLRAKILLQELCSSGLSWDAEVCGRFRTRWLQWMSDLPLLEQVQVQRCYKPRDFGKVAVTEIHIFCDASNVGYGMVSYMRLINDKGEIHCSLLMAKARVAPLKAVTIPRMELTAAVLAVRLGKVLLNELDCPVDNVFYWTDSTSVLKYIANEKTRFHTFVANRVTEIRETSQVNQWHYIETACNPADFASRGLRMDKFLQEKTWFNGPLFLWGERSEWPISQAFSKDLNSDDPETKKPTAAFTSVQQPQGIEKLIQYYSDWNKLKRAVAWITRFVDILRQRALKKDCPVNSQLSEDLQVSDLQKAEIALVRYTQQQDFVEEMLRLGNQQEGRPLSKTLSKLDPVLDEGVVRVGGRLARADMPYNSKHPVLLPKDALVSQLIIQDCHRQTGHQGKNTMLASLRKRYWILGASTSIKSLLAKCVTCRRYRAKAGEQKMADLPKERLKTGEPPFTQVGLDFFGPFDVKRGRSVVKRYGVIFTCLSIRAVHLEVASSLDTDSCINALRRFIARRGTVKFIRSDNGTNLVGCEKELRQEISKWNTSKINQMLTKKGITWEFNPPGGSHFGGIWERMIRSVRKILNGLSQEQVIRLDDEGLHTLLCEVEAIINSRPITDLGDCPSDLEPLTPNHLLNLDCGDSLPPGIFEPGDSYFRRRWRQIQYLADIFWKRWTAE